MLVAQDPGSACLEVHREAAKAPTSDQALLQTLLHLLA